MDKIPATLGNLSHAWIPTEIFKVLLFPAEKRKVPPLPAQFIELSAINEAFP